MALQTTALEDTTIKVGPARKTSYKGKMARRSKKSKRKDNQDRSVKLPLNFIIYFYDSSSNISDKYNLQLLTACSSIRRRSVLKKLSKQSTVMHGSRSFSSGLHHSVSSSESLPGSPTHSLSPGPSTPCRSPIPDHSTGKITQCSTLGC